MKKTLLIGISLVLLATFIGLLYSQPVTGNTEVVQAGQQAWMESLSTEIDTMLSGLLEESTSQGDSLQQLVAYFSPKRP